MIASGQDKYLNFLQGSGNFLLIKDSMGKPKPSTRDLPGDGYTYGKKLQHDPEGVGALLTSWAEHKVSVLPKSDKDFKKLNALAVAEGAVTASKQRKFREIAEVRVKSASQRSRFVVPDMIFGTSGRPSTPMKAVIGNFYGEYAADLKSSTFTPKEQKRNIPVARSTKGFDKRNESIKNSMQEQEKQRFKLKRFSSVQAKTSSRRNNT